MVNLHVDLDLKRDIFKWILHIGWLKQAVFIE